MKEAIIIDIDGTIIDSSRAQAIWGSNPNTDFNDIMKTTMLDPPNKWCVEIVGDMISQGKHVIFLTARDEEYRSITKQWLQTHVGYHGYTLLMRAIGDNRNDCLIKTDIFYKEIFHSYNVLFAIDDKASVVDMWRNLGVPALHCASYYS